MRISTERTCDDKFLRKAKGFDGLNIKVVSPTELVMEIDIWVTWQWLPVVREPAYCR